MKPIRHEKDNIESWICHCGNNTHSQGFYPCNEHGYEIDVSHGIVRLQVTVNGQETNTVWIQK